MRPGPLAQLVRAAGIISWGVGAKVSARVYTLKCVYVLCVAKNFYLIRETFRHVQTLVVVESVVVLNHTGNNHVIPEGHRFKPCMAHITRTAEICALNISSKSWQAYFKVFSLHELINMIVRDQHCYRRIDRKARASGFKQWCRT